MKPNWFPENINKFIMLKSEGSGKNREYSYYQQQELENITIKSNYWVL